MSQNHAPATPAKERFLAADDGTFSQSMASAALEADELLQTVGAGAHAKLNMAAAVVAIAFNAAHDVAMLSRTADRMEPVAFVELVLRLREFVKRINALEEESDLRFWPLAPTQFALVGGHCALAVAADFSRSVSLETAWGQGISLHALAKLKREPVDRRLVEWNSRFFNHAKAERALYPSEWTAFELRSQRQRIILHIEDELAKARNACDAASTRSTGESTATLDPESEFVPTDPDIAILQFLAARSVLLKAHAVNPLGVSPSMVKRRLKVLGDQNLVHRPEGANSGWAATVAGKRLAKDAHAMRTQRAH